jgi:hypothetical protein
MTLQRQCKGLSNMAMAMLLKRMGQPTITVHGFRSTFRDWTSELASFPHEFCEMALATARLTLIWLAGSELALTGLVLALVNLFSTLDPAWFFVVQKHSQF